MTSFWGAATAGYAALIEQNQHSEGKCTVSLFTFNHLVDTCYRNLDILQVPDLRAMSYYPCGSTALWDAIGEGISKTGLDLASLPESERPGKVLFTIITDGEENVSTRFSQEDIAKMRRHQQEKYAWEFVFIGAEDAGHRKVAATGIANRFKYQATHEGTRSMFDRLTKQVVAYRNASSYQSGDFWKGQA